MSVRLWLTGICLGLTVDAAARGEEWQSLFNGQDLSGWEVVDGQAGSWGAADGLIFTTGQGGGWLSTTAEYGDFELELEFRLPPGGNSGVFLRAPHQGDPAYTGLEVQVLDDAAPEYANLKPTQYTGSVYDLEPAQPRVTRPAGEWQRMRIVCQGRRVTVTLNGTQIVATNLDDHLAHAERHPGLQRSAGHVGLQNHGARVEYRHLRLRPL